MANSTSGRENLNCVIRNCDDDDDDERDKYDEEPGNCLEMEEGVHLVTRTATAAAPSDLSGQTFLG